MGGKSFRIEEAKHINYVMIGLKGLQDRVLDEAYCCLKKSCRIDFMKC